MLRTKKNQLFFQLFHDSMGDGHGVTKKTRHSLCIPCAQVTFELFSQSRSACGWSAQTFHFLRSLHLWAFMEENNISISSSFLQRTRAEQHVGHAETTRWKASFLALAACPTVRRLHRWDHWDVDGMIVGVPLLGSPGNKNRWIMHIQIWLVVWNIFCFPWYMG